MIILRLVKSLLRKIAHRLRELPLHLDRLFSISKDKSILIFPSSTEGVASSRERAYRLGSHLKQLGWRVVLVPPQLELAQRLRILKLEKPRVVLLQKSRHPLNRPHLYKTELLVFDIDDADFFDDQQTEVINNCCLGSDLVLCGSEFVAQYCRQFNSNVHVQWTGMDMKNVDFTPPSLRSNIVAWGTSGSLAYSDERRFIGEIAMILIEKIDFELWIYGASPHPDLTQFVDVLGHHGIKVKLIPPMNIERYHASLGKCAVGLHPVSLGSPFSRGKSFGKLNSYMLTGTPVVVQDALDYPEFFFNRLNGMLATETSDWAIKIHELLINLPMRDSLAKQARIDFERLLSTKSVSQKVDNLLSMSLKKGLVGGIGY